MRSLTKVIFRQIKTSLGRYLAILAIVALGVGFFGGLKCTKPSMIKTLNTYIENNQLFDFRLLSTIGFEEADIENLKSELGKYEDITSVEGSYSVDAICIVGEAGGADAGSSADSGAYVGGAAYKLHAVTDSVNQVYLLSGRMPENSGECIVDDYMSGLNIGDCITISSENEEDTLDMLKSHTLEVVGTCRSPYYINFERGTTSIGTGKLNGFIYVPKEEFDSEYYTEVFVKLKDRYGAYTDEYDNYSKEYEDYIEGSLESVIDSRFQNLVKDAQDELDSARKELEEKKSEAQDKLDDAYLELKDAEKEIADNEKLIEDGEKQLEDGKKTLSSKEAELSASKEQILAGMQTMPGMAGQDVPAGMQTMPGMDAVSQQYMFAAMLEQIEAGEKEIAKQRSVLASKEKELDDGKLELEDAKKKVSDGWKEYNDSEADFDKEIADANQKLEDAQKEIDDLEDPETFVLNRNTNIGYACYESDSNIVAAVANVFPVFFFLVAVLICITTMNRMVEEQRTQIGIYKALGYTSFSIMLIFTVYSGSAALIGAVAGYAVGSRLLPLAIWQGYNIMYNMGHVIEYQSVTYVAVSSIALALLCAVGSAYFSVIYELRDVPANLIRPKSPKNGKRIFLEYIPFIWKRMKFLHKVSARNILRYKKRFLMMVVGISGCTALVLTGLGIGDSIKGIADLQYENIQVYDMSVTFSESAGESSFAEARNIEGVESIAFYNEATMDVSANSKMKSATIVTPEDEKEFMEYLVLNDLETGESLQYPSKGEAVITMRISQALDVGKGDTITVQDADLNTMTAKITGICENYVYSYVYVNKDTYTEGFEKNLPINSAWANVSDEMDKHLVSTSMMKADDVMNVSVIADLQERIDTMMAGMDFIVLIVILCAAALALIVLYNLTNINITERIREIATIKVLGFYANEAAQYVFRENMVLTGIGALVGLPLGKLLHSFVMYNIKIDMVSFKTYIAPLSYVLAVAITFGFAVLVNFLMYFKLQKINMAESLKSIE